ncbi:TPA: hypothetical protein N2C61_002094 [Pseudomonas aeruginosa]|nr:hypothetical protein [Pseudomonas aeruginosa]
MTISTVDIQTTRFADQGQSMRACAAMIQALACSSKGFTRAGVTFEKNGLLTHAMHSGQVVAVLSGGFCMQKVLDCIRSNIADHAQHVALHLKPTLDALALPAGHVLRLDMAQNLADILNRGSCRLSAQVHAAAHDAPNQIHADFQFFLGECRLLLLLKAGDRFDAGEVMINEELVAETYSGLAESAVAAVNQAIAGLLG